MKILLFGITREITGKTTLVVPDDAGLTTVKDLKRWLFKRYPAMQGLSSLAVAVDSEYADDGDMLNIDQEIALIPPVSGG